MISNRTGITLLAAGVVAGVVLISSPLRVDAAEEQSQNMRALIEQALDQQVDITIEKQPISEAFELIGNQTGIKLVIRPQVVELLPYGTKTMVNATIKNVSLREGLDGMLRHLAMKIQVRDNDVAIEPTEPLRRICRRVTWSQLRQLHKMLTTPWSREEADKLLFQFQVRTNADARKQLLDEASQVGPGSLADVLEMACNRLGWTWYPWDNSIIVLTQEDQASRYLEKLISIRYSHAALADVFSDLARKADLRLRLEPGVLKGLPLQTRQNFSLMAREATIRTALEMISGATGLGYEVTPKEIVIKHTNASKAAATQQTTVIRADNPLVGEIHIQGKDGTSYSFWIRESDLPPEVNAWRKRKIQETVESMRQDASR